MASSTAICLRRMGAQSFRTPCALRDPIGRAGQWILQMMMRGGERGEEVESSCLSNGRHAALLKTPDAFTEYAPLFSVRVASPVLNRSLCYRKPEDYGDRVLCGNTWKAYETSGCAPVLIVMEERGGASLGMSERCGGDNQRRH